MNRLMGVLLICLAGLAWSAPWYTTVAVDDSGAVCAGSSGAFSQGEYGVLSPQFDSTLLFCQNNFAPNYEIGSGIAHMLMFGRDEILYATISYFNDVNKTYDESGVYLDNPQGSNTLEMLALRGILKISNDSILFANKSGIQVNSKMLNSSRSFAGLPSELATSPVRSLAKDFMNRLWAGTDSGVWVQDAEGDTTWTYHAVGWPVKNIFPMDTNLVVVASFHMALDGYDATTAKKACFENDSMRASCSTTAYALVNLCPRPGECFEVNSPYSGLHYIDHGVDVRAVALPYTFDLALAPNGKLWAATGYGLYSIDTATFVATREYIGLDTPVVATLPHASQQRLWSVAQQGRNLRVQSSVAGAVELIDLTGHRVSHAEVNREARTLAVPHAGVWLVRWTSVKGVVDVRRVVVN